MCAAAGERKAWPQRANSLLNAPHDTLLSAQEDIAWYTPKCAASASTKTEKCQFRTEKCQFRTEKLEAARGVSTHTTPPLYDTPCIHTVRIFQGCRSDLIAPSG